MYREIAINVGADPVSVLKKLNEEFEGKDVDVVTLQIAVRDKVVETETEADLDVVTLSNKTIEDTLLNNTIVDVNSTENFEKIKKVLDEY